MGSLATVALAAIGVSATVFSNELNALVRQHVFTLDATHWILLSLVVVAFLLILLFAYLNAGKNERIDELEARNRDLVEQLETDTKSGLSSYDFFIRKFDDEYVPAAREGSVFSVLMIDIVGFKSINDTLGHDAGDEAISLIGGFLKSFVRGKRDLAARYGEAADEFFFIISGDTAALTGFTNRLRRELEQECTENFELLKSAGIVLKFWSSATSVSENDSWEKAKTRLTKGLVQAKDIPTESTVIIASD
ncbi:GGDEF domain-containing protein [Ruegeria sediminis]|uniref:GGDEF domain-containing protein n=1 Tax=Ruegeria sediminis TaxID=2583820 RepID=UPI001485FCCE|nr:GGDEF domain-containing protein [Ruegeria sediminis]